MKEINLEEVFANAKKYHKKTYSNFDITVPRTTPAEMAEGLITESRVDVIDLKWCKYPFQKARKTYEILKANFEKECCDLVRMTDPNEVFLLATNELNPNFKSSQRWSWVGIVVITDFTINWCWLHPFLRNRGLMKRFLVEYSISYLPILVMPPITDAMLRCLNASTKMVRADKELLEQQYTIKRNFLKAHYGPQVEEFDHEYLDKAFTGYCDWGYVEGFNDLPEEERNTLMRVGFQILYYCFKNPEYVESMKNNEQLLQYAEKLHEKKQFALKFSTLE